ncbi:MAG: restriction endonuclease subunit S [Waterburya sp.]
MPIPSEIQSLVDRLNLELEITEREAKEGLSLVRPILSSFPDNVRLIQFLALFNNGLLFVEISRRRIQAILERLTAPDVTTLEIQEVGEDLGILLGQCLEAKIRGKRILDILKDLE